MKPPLEIPSIQTCDEKRRISLGQPGAALTARGHCRRTPLMLGNLIEQAFDEGPKLCVSRSPIPTDMCGDSLIQMSSRRDEALLRQQLVNFIVSLGKFQRVRQHSPRRAILNRKTVPLQSPVSLGRSGPGN